MHTPVLLQEVLKYLDPEPGDFVIDGTADGGGHAEAILAKIGSRGTLLALDWDKSILDECKKRLHRPKNVVFVNANYRDIPEILTKKKLGKADGLLLDLGFSSLQIEGLGRGFSFKKELGSEPLLMTYSGETEPVWKILKSIKEDDLARIIRELGGERLAGRIARVIKERTRKRTIETSGELADLIRGVLPKFYERGRIDPATRTFQALRIYANKELENVEAIVASLPEVMEEGGRVVILTFHSLEDRIVKHAFRKLEKDGPFKILTKKPIEPSREEIINNTRSRSAKLRAIERT
ncbi:MAG: 16S rRNA (cytosine(1402)-N(4))-methyltransferase RsmH [Patescibacteria group bacterium]